MNATHVRNASSNQ